MKQAVLIFGIIFMAFIARAQIMVTGSVKDVQGKPLHYVFVGNNNEDNVATFTDSLGNFTLAVHNAKGLYFDLKGYKSTSVNLDKGDNLQVVLQPGESTEQQATLNAVPTQSSAVAEIPTFDQGGGVTPAHQQGALHGNRYLFNNFVHGFVINSTGLVHNPAYLFDYDKIAGTLLLTSDNKKITVVPLNEITSFTLFDNHDKTTVFVKMPAIDNVLYVQLLAQGKQFDIYKLTKTLFVKSDYVNTGVSSHGNDYDEYVDDYTYYVYNVQTKALQKISLRKKSLKTAFAADAEKLDKFMNDHSSDEIDDTYLSNLGASMNE